MTVGRGDIGLYSMPGGDGGPGSSLGYWGSSQDATERSKPLPPRGLKCKKLVWSLVLIVIYLLRGFTHLVRGCAQED
jgi:hypothetical protein